MIKDKLIMNCRFEKRRDSEATLINPSMKYTNSFVGNGDLRTFYTTFASSYNNLLKPQPSNDCPQKIL